MQMCIHCAPRATPAAARSCTAAHHTSLQRAAATLRSPRLPGAAQQRTALPCNVLQPPWRGQGEHQFCAHVQPQTPRRLNGRGAVTGVLRGSAGGGAVRFERHPGSAGGGAVRSVCCPGSAGSGAVRSMRCHGHCDAVQLLEARSLKASWLSLTVVQHGPGCPGLSWWWCGTSQTPSWPLR